MKNLLIDFDSLAGGASKIEKKLTAAFTKAGAEVVSVGSDGRAKRTAGITYRDVLVTFADGQTITLPVKGTGDIYAAKVNGTVFPLKNPDDHAAAIKELVKAMEAGRAKFQAKQAKQKVDLPAGTKSKAASMGDQLKAQVADLDAQIAEATTKRDALKAELGDTAMDSIEMDEEAEGEQPESEEDEELEPNEDQGSLFDEAKCGACENPSSDCVCDGAMDAATPAGAVVHIIDGGQVTKVLDGDSFRKANGFPCNHDLGQCVKRYNAARKEAGDSVRAQAVMKEEGGKYRVFDDAGEEVLDSVVIQITENGKTVEECGPDNFAAMCSPIGSSDSPAPGFVDSAHCLKAVDAYNAMQTVIGSTRRAALMHVGPKHGEALDDAALDATDYNDPSWHSRKMAEMKTKSVESLRYIIKDAREAAKAARSLGNDKAEGRYEDEAHYASMELKKREDAAKKSGKALDSADAKIGKAELKSLLVWRDMGTTDGVKTLALYMKDPERPESSTGQMKASEVWKEKGGNWYVENETKGYPNLAQAKARAIEVAAAQAKKWGYYDPALDSVEEPVKFERTWSMA